MVCLNKSEEIEKLKAEIEYLELELRGERRVKLELAERLGCADEPRWKWILMAVDDLIEQEKKNNARTSEA